MPPRIQILSSSLTKSPARSVRPVLRCQFAAARPCTRLYSTAQEEPLIKISEVPAPNTGHIRILTLNRPKVHNALSRALVAALRAEIDDVAQQYDAETGNEVPHLSWNRQFDGEHNGKERGPTRALIIASSSSSTFCAGADLKERKGFTPEETAEFLANLRSTFDALSALPIPTISAISSRALGGGFELALSTHFRVMTWNATVALPETKLGIIPGAGGTHRLPALIGVSRARDIILTGRVVSAEEANRIGIADRLVGSYGKGRSTGLSTAEWEQLRRRAEALRVRVQVLSAAKVSSTTAEKIENIGIKAERITATTAELYRDMTRLSATRAAIELANEICTGGPVAVRAALQAVQQPSHDMEDRMYNRIVGTEDRNEALRAFSEKRKPVFQGR